ncbi:MAG TPA: DUF222 domain-containing protein [Pseudonocardiaceae bacterium]
MSVAVCDPVRELSSGLDDLRGSLPALGDQGVVQALRDVETLSRQVMSVLVDVVAETDARGIAAAEGFGTTARLLGAVLRLSASDARGRVDQARLLGARRSVLGEALPPQLPATAAALAAGRIGAGQLRVITDTLTTLPSSVPDPVREQVETDLAGYAADFDPRRLRTIAHRMSAHLDPDGPEPTEPEPPLTPVRGEVWLRERRDGRLGIDGWLDAEHGTTLRTLIEQLAAPRPAVEGVRDLRSVPHRQADALIDLADYARAAQGFPIAGGEPPHVSVTIDWDALRTGVGTAALDHGRIITAGQARRLACDAAILPVVLGTDSEPLDLGRATRTAPRALRRALTARDRGCSFPGCHRPPQLCAVHHIRHWADGGSTSVGNCCLICAMHHQQVHLQGWDLTVHRGQVRYRPPTMVDPERKPLVNPYGKRTSRSERGPRFD